jgi:outer membrane protein TolC
LARARVAARAAQSAQRSVTTATDLWNNGLAAHADVLDAHSQLTDAQFECIAAAADAALATAALEHAVGALAPPPEVRE